jgi:DNA replication protein DnaC
MLKADMKDKLRALRLNGWIESWNTNMKMGVDEGLSLERLVTMMVDQEYHRKQGNALRRRVAQANIEDEWRLSTYPFDRQPELERRKIMTVYDAMEYARGHRNIVWVGPTGCGKTGLATSFLMQALEQGYSGRLVSFSQLVQELYQSAADHSEHKVLRPYSRCDCLVIDEIGYMEVEPAQVGLFFDLLHRRHKKSGTLITTNLGFSEWGTFLKNDHLTAALLDRLTEHCDVFNMSKCISLRKALHKT